MTAQTSLPVAGHFEQLREAYRAVGDRTWVNDDFAVAALESSRNLFTPDSLATRQPRPKALEVYALVSGIPFRTDVQGQLGAIQQDIGRILGSTLHYWVAPQNLGVEYAVFKWPHDAWDPSRLPVIEDALLRVREPAFRFDIRGVQINPDGCVVARGFDEDGTLFRIREQLRKSIPFLPAKQSGWAHVPLGRILEPTGVSGFSRLSTLIRGMSETLIVTTAIDSMSLVHETRWYMEEKSVLARYPLRRMPGAEDS